MFSSLKQKNILNSPICTLVWLKKKIEKFENCKWQTSNTKQEDNLFNQEKTKHIQDG